jgi:predicted nucleic acid-binding Zn ribbon protein
VTWKPSADPNGRALHRLGDGIDAVLRRCGGSSGAATVGVFGGWDDAVGPGVAAHAQPIALRGSTLVVGVDAPAYATQLRLLTPQLLARLAELTSPGVVEAVEVRVRG